MRFRGRILRYVKSKHYFLVFAYFCLSSFYFLQVLVLLKFHRAKFHGCKQRRYFVNSPSKVSLHGKAYSTTRDVTSPNLLCRENKWKREKIRRR